MIAAIVLAAGQSSRMGQPKALLKIGNVSFLNYIIKQVKKAGLKKIIVVIGANRREIEAELKNYKGDVIINHFFERGQLSSIIAGLEKIRGDKKVKGFLVCLVDHPLPKAATMKKIVQQFTKNKKLIALPKYQSAHGHPILFSSALIDELTNASMEIGARQVVWNHSQDIWEVETNDEGVIANIDTPDDYKKYITKKKKK